MRITHDIEIAVRPGTDGDMEAIGRLLRASGLPTQDLGTEDLGTEDLATAKPIFVVALAGEKLVGCAGLERFGSYALLRSLAVESSFRNRGIAGNLVGFARERAVAAGASELLLLTTTAEGFFLRLGFESIPRESAPHELAASTQLSSVCPSSAILMRQKLAPTRGLFARPRER